MLLIKWEKKGDNQTHSIYQYGFILQSLQEVTAFHGSIQSFSKRYIFTPDDMRVILWANVSNIMSYLTLLTPEVTSKVSSMSDFSYQSCLSLVMRQTCTFSSAVKALFQQHSMQYTVTLHPNTEFTYPGQALMSRAEQSHAKNLCFSDTFQQTHEHHRGCEPSFY